MARQVLPLVGAVAGFAVGGPTGAQIGFALGSLVGNAVDPIEMQGRKLGDSPTQVAAEGGARAIVYGKGCIRATCILERGGRRVIKQRDSSGGKGGGPTTINERALWTFAIGLGEAIPNGALLRIWENEKLVYDVTPTSTIAEDTEAFSERFRFYDGNESQLPDPALEALHGADTPYYRGTAYMVFPQYDLTDFGETVPTYRVEVVTTVIDLPVDRIPNFTFPHGANQLGGTAPGGFSTYTNDFSSAPLTWAPYVDGPYLNWQPLLMAEAFIHSGSQTAVRAQVLDDAGAVVADSGWIGDPAWQSVLDQNLIDNSRGDLLGPIIGFGTAGPGLMTPDPAGPGTSVWMEIRLPADRRLQTMRLYRSGQPLSGSTGAAVQIYMPSPPDLPAGAEAFSDVFGIYTSDEGFFATQWGAATVEIPGDSIPLGSIVASAHLRCGHASDDYDVSELTEDVVGVVIESTVTGAEAINSIIGSHFADPSDYDGEIHYIKRGKPAVLTLTEDDLIDEPDEAQRNNAIEYPKKVHFLGQRADLAYASSKSTSARYSDDAKVVGEITIGSPETYDDGASPAEVAVKLHKVLWTEAEGEREWMIPDNYLGLVPTDNVGLSYRGELVRCRILNVEDTPGQRKLRMIRDRQSAYTANLTEIPNPPAPTPPQSSVVAPTVMAFIDTSALTDNADTLHYLVALSGANDNWAGAVLQQQLGGSFSSIDSTNLNSIMGTLQNVVPDASPYYTDTTNTAVVRLFTDDQLEAQTQEQFLSNGGAFFLSWEDSGQTQWEIMQFRDVDQDSNGDWVLSHFMRGRKNTETAEHPMGATFVLIDPSILRESAQTSWINTVLTHRAVSNGQSPELAAVQNNDYVGNSQREWPVAGIELNRDDPDTLEVSVNGRHRFGSSMNPIQSVNWLGLRILATDGTNTESFDTTSFNQSFDVTGWGPSITVTVWQINRLTGLSEPVIEVIP